MLTRRVEWNKAVHDSQAGQLRPSDPVTLVLALAPMKETDIFRRKKSIYIFVKTAAVLTFERFSIDYQR